MRKRDGIARKGTLIPLTNWRTHLGLAGSPGLCCKAFPYRDIGASLYIEDSRHRTCLLSVVVWSRVNDTNSRLGMGRERGSEMHVEVNEEIGREVVT